MWTAGSTCGDSNANSNDEIRMTNQIPMFKIRNEGHWHCFEFGSFEFDSALLKSSIAFVGSASADRLFRTKENNRSAEADPTKRFSAEQFDSSFEFRHSIFSDPPQSIVTSFPFSALA